VVDPVAPDVLIALRSQCDAAARRVVALQNLDAFSPTFGCIDRRFWAWKLTDVPEATYQRNVYPLALLYRDARSPLFGNDRLRDSIVAGLLYLSRVQHANGAFDQAFYREYSFASTAFLLHPVLETCRLMGDAIPEAVRRAAEAVAHRAGAFLASTHETHGVISNHLAGAALSLLTAGRHFGEQRFVDRAQQFLQRIRRAASASEGWLREYDGADPGYQTLGHYFLAQIEEHWPELGITDLLDASEDFISYFLHPDGTFGGCYGSRRTAICYPGGFALRAGRSDKARAITCGVATAAAELRTVSLVDIDLGNLAPLLTCWVVALHRDEWRRGPAARLPRDEPDVVRDFPHAGIHIRGTPSYYAIVGSANGGTVRVVNKLTQAPAWDDGGYIGKTEAGRLVSSQGTQIAAADTAPDEISCDAVFHAVPTSQPGPWLGIGIRLLGLSVLRSVWAGSILKRLIVGRLITPRTRLPLHLSRRISFTPAGLTITDRITSRLRLRWLAFGTPFVAVHMASARYLEGSLADPLPTPRYLDVLTLASKGVVVEITEVVIEEAVRA
jgi:hypothetical protein